MNVPAVAQKTYNRLQNNIVFVGIVKFIINRLNKISKPHKRARFIHSMVDEFNVEIFKHELVKQLSPCKMGCTGCCHTQVSVTEDEAQMLADKINNGLKIDRQRLQLQALAENNDAAFYKINYEDRKCIFLGDAGLCSVYEDRPSVCRTNAVLGSSMQCDTSESVKPTRLVLTEKADMAIYASFLFAKSSGTLPNMVKKYIKV
jgi:uncharacterized protein